MLNLLNETTFANKVFDFSKNEKSWTNLDSKPSCVVFFNNWCTYCNEIQAIVEKLENRYKDTINFYRINCDDNKALSNSLKIVSVPAVLFVPLIGEPQMLKGLFPQHMIEFLINDILM